MRNVSTDGFVGSTRREFCVSDQFTFVQTAQQHSHQLAIPLLQLIHSHRNRHQQTYKMRRMSVPLTQHVGVAVIALVALALVPTATAWGGIFNRFSPEMLSNLGYGAQGGLGNYREHQPFLQRYESPEEMLQELEETEEEPCWERKCTANEHCCAGSVCIYTDDLMGKCMFLYGLRQGEMCHNSLDCEKGLFCHDTGDTRTCQTPLDNKKQYSENCMTSSECDISKGLCCQLQRRHRQAPRKVCSYFKDPLVCSGHVATDQIINQIEHTAGEKRLTGKLNHYNHNNIRK